MSEKIMQNEESINLDIRKAIIQLFNSKEYHELKLYYDFKGIFDILGIMRLLCENRKKKIIDNNKRIDIFLIYAFSKIKVQI